MNLSLTWEDRQPDPFPAPSPGPVPAPAPPPEPEPQPEPIPPNPQAKDAPLGAGPPVNDRWLCRADPPAPDAHVWGWIIGGSHVL